MGGSTLLGLGKERGEKTISFLNWKANSSKGGILRKLERISDPLGFVSPVALVGKCLYRSMCCEKLHGFGDTSACSVGSVVYAVVRQESGINRRVSKG